jgi:tripartite-type tricarboxylate transporter receptor subunit TctC
MSGRVLVLAWAAVVMAAAAGGETAAQPDARPLRLIVPFAAGEPPDVLARLVGDEMGARLRHPVLIENRPGAAATFGTQLAAAAEPDGRTLLIAGTTSLSMAPSLFNNIEYDPASSFAPVGEIAREQMVLVVHPALPARTMHELTAHARSNPGMLRYGAAVASVPHFAWGLLGAVTGTDIRFVPYRATASARDELAAGQLQIMIDGMGALMPHIRAGDVRPLAVTGRARSPDLADLPTMAESGYPDLVLSLWTGMVAPAGTPAAAVAKLNSALNETLSSPGVRSGLAKLSLEPSTSSPQQLGELIVAEAARWGSLIRTIKAR